MRTYTLGEIVRLGLLKNHKGEPYRHKASVNRLLAGKKKIKMPHGVGYQITQSEIDKLNKRWRY